MKSPSWLKEELLLALELYLSKDISWLSKMSDSTMEVVQLSLLLNSLSLHDDDSKPDKFRSTGSIRMKLSNFKALDEKYGKSSLTNLSKTDIEIWNEYHNDLPRVRKECAEILNKYLKPNSLDDIHKYVEHIFIDNDSTANHNDFILFAVETFEKATSFLIENNDKEIEATCRKLQLILEKYKYLAPKTKDIPLELYGGINLIPVHRSEIKIGKYVRNTMKTMISEKKITDQLLLLLTDAKWSKDILHLGHAFFVEVDITDDIRKQTRDENGYQRYWTAPYEIDGKHYCICKEWYEYQRKHFDKWVNSICNSFNAGVSEIQFVKLLEFIKKADSTQVFIDRSDLFEKMLELSNSEQIVLLNKFVSVGLLKGINGSEHELVVEDYELLYQMLDNPRVYL